MQTSVAGAGFGAKRGGLGGCARVSVPVVASQPAELWMECPAAVERTRENSRLDLSAAGSSARAPGPVPKQYRPLSVGSAVARSVAVMLAQPGIDLVQVVIAAGDRPHYDRGAAVRWGALLPPVAGWGATRQQSALQACSRARAHAPDCVLIHDSGRPFVTADVIARAGRPGAARPLPSPRCRDRFA